MSSPTVVPSPDEWMYEVDRLYISRHSSGPLVVVTTGIYGDPAAPDAPPTLSLIPQFTSTPEVPVRTYTMVPVPGAVHTWAAPLPSTDTSIPGPYLAQWTYTVGGTSRIGEQPIMVGGTAPAYDALSPQMKAVVEDVWLRVADMFDSPMGGPHLQVYMQAHFGRNRIAQLLRVAIGHLNTRAQPMHTYAVDKDFPHAQWGPLLSQVLWVEVIKHLQRSYMEQPDPVGVTVARLDRRSYSQAWGALLAQEEAALRPMLDIFKMQSMNLGGGSVLVAGGIYPTVSAQSPGLANIAAPRGIYLTRGLP